MNDKFEITDITKIFRGIPGREVVLHRIRALDDIIFPTVIDDQQLAEAATIIRMTSSLRGEKLEKWLTHFFAKRRLLKEVIPAGELGGWVESEANLSQSGTCWIGDEAIVASNARVAENARVFEHACITGEATASGNSLVRGRAQLRGRALVNGFAAVDGRAILDGDAHVFGCTTTTDYAWLYGQVEIGGIVRSDGFTVAKSGSVLRQEELPKWYPARIKARMLPLEASPKNRHMRRSAFSA